MSNDYTVCSECGFGALEYQFKKTKGICPKCKKWNVLNDSVADSKVVSEHKFLNGGN